MEYIISVLTLGKGWGYLKYGNNQWQRIHDKRNADVFITKKEAYMQRKAVVKSKLFDDGIVEVC